MLFYTHTTTVPIFSLFIDNISRPNDVRLFFRLRARAPEIHHSVIKHKFIKNIYSLIKNVKRLRISSLTAPMHDDVDERTTKFIILIWLLVGAFSIP